MSLPYRLGIPLCLGAGLVLWSGIAAESRRAAAIAGYDLSPRAERLAGRCEATLRARGTGIVRAGGDGKARHANGPVCACIADRVGEGNPATARDYAIAGDLFDGMMTFSGEDDATDALLDRMAATYGLDDGALLARVQSVTRALGTCAREAL